MVFDPETSLVQPSELALRPCLDPSLYLMGIALYRIWQLAPIPSGWVLGLTFFFIQLVLNALWSPLFFGLHDLWLAFAEYF